MKKIFLFAVAAMVSLSSCVQTNEVYTGNVQEMGFKSAVTRGIIQSNDDMVYPIAVSATWENPTLAQWVTYFESAEFVYDADTQLWKGNPAKYWPTSGDMQFLAFCPYPVKAKITNAYTVEGKFESATFGTVDNNLMEQHDVIFSDLLEVSAPQTSAQPLLLFHHAYAQLNVTFKKTDSAAAHLLFWNTKYYISSVIVKIGIITYIRYRNRGGLTMQIRAQDIVDTINQVGIRLK